MPLLFPDLVAEIAFATNPASAYLRVVANMVADANAYRLDDMTGISDYVIQAGDHLEYDIWWETTGARIGFDFEVADYSRFSQSGAVDQDARAATMSTDINTVAFRQWYHRKFPIPAALVGKTVKYWLLFCDKDDALTTEGRVRDITITDGFTTIRKDVWRQVQSLPALAMRRHSPAGANSTTVSGGAVAEGATTVTVVSTASFPAAGQVEVGDPISDFGNDGVVFSYTSKNATQFLGCVGVPAMVNGETVRDLLTVGTMPTTRDYEVPVFEDVTPWLLEAHPRRGRRKPLDRVTKGQMTAVLDNADGRFESENTDSPYWPNVVAGRRMRVRVRRYFELVAAEAPDSLWRLNDDTAPNIPVPVADTMRNVNGVTTGVAASTPLDLQPELAYGDWEELSMGFDGGDRIEAGDNYRFAATLPFAISALVRTGVLAVDGVRRHVVGHLRTDGGGRQGWALTVLDKKIRISRFRNGVEQFVQYGTNLADNTIYHVAATYDGAGDQKLRLYLNGSLAGSADSFQAIIDGAATLVIGNIVGGTEGWLGRLSNVAVWDNAVLTAEQIDAHYDKSFFAYWGNLFDGQIEDWPVNWKGRLPEVSLTVNDAFGGFEQARVSGFRAVEYSGARIGWVLDQANFAGGRRLDPGRSLVEESSSVAETLLDNDEALEHMLAIAESEVGVFFIAGDGAAVFHDRLRRPLSASAIQGTFTNDPVYAGVGGKLAVDIVPSKSIEDVLNDIRLRPVAGTTDAVVVDLGSQLQYGLRSLPRTVWLTSLLECQNQGEWMISQFRKAELRFDEIMIDPKRDLDGLAPQVLRREISDRIEVGYRMPSGEPGLIDNMGPLVSKECHIEEVAHDIVSREAGWSWETRWVLSSAESQAYWILGDAANSLLGQSTVLGY